jgi:hypothetical protein
MCVTKKNVPIISSLSIPYLSANQTPRARYKMHQEESNTKGTAEGEEEIFFLSFSCLFQLEEMGRIACSPAVLQLKQGQKKLKESMQIASSPSADPVSAEVDAVICPLSFS